MFDHVGKWLEKKAKANFKIHDVINWETNKYKIHILCVQSVRIWSYSGPHFPAFELNMDRYSVSLRIQSECRKMRTRITPNTDTFHAVISQFITKFIHPIYQAIRQWNNITWQIFFFKNHVANKVRGLLQGAVLLKS